MDFGLRDWLLVLGPVFVIGVLLHGYWRMRSNRNTIRMSLDKSFMSAPGEHATPEEDLSMLKAELPNGGARVRTVASPEQKALDLNEDVPVLMEPVDMGRTDESPAVSAPAADETDAHAHAQDEIAAAEPASPPPSPKSGQRPEHFVVLYVTCIKEPFAGQRLLESLVELDMRFGEMSLFHRLDHNEVPQFSLVNAVEPGTFDLNQMDELQTPAVSLFMRAHELDEPVKAFDEMIHVAQSLADELGGEVKDQSRSVMTPQTIEHCREEITDYQHKYY